MKLISAKAYAFSPLLRFWLIITEVVEVVEVVFRFVLVFQVTIGLQVVLGDLVVSQVGVTPVLFVVRFLELVKEIDGVDELFFWELVLISFPLLLKFWVEGINSPFTGHPLF